MQQPITEGFCQCGCGQRTNRAKISNRRYGHVKGQYLRFVKGHSKRPERMNRPVSEPNPSGLCFCGCGQLTPIAIETNTPLLRFKGKHIRYINGHQKRSTKTAFTVDEATGCWNWNRCKDGCGYGLTTLNHRHMRAHIAYYIRRFGPVPNGYELHHVCVNPGCVNPDHLQLITHAEHMHLSPRTKLTVDQVRDIRRLYAQGDVSQSTLAEQFGVSAPTISAIITRRNWKDI